MIFVGDDKIDFSKPEVVKFVKSAATGATLPGIPGDHAGYHHAALPPIGMGRIPSPPKNPFFVPWTVIQTWILRDGGPNGENIATFTIETVSSRTVEVEATFHLLVQDKTDPVLEDKICEIFSKYMWPDSGDVDAYVRQALREDPSLDSLMFAVARTCDYTVTGETETDNSQLDLIHSRPDWSSERYSIVLVNHQDLDSHRPLTPNPNPEKVAEEAARRDKAESHCEGYQTRTYRIGRLDYLPESRVSWGWHKVVIDCIIFDLYYPTTEFRNRESIATMHITIPPDATRYEKAIIECATTSAALAIVQLILFVDLTSALVTLKTLFWKCISGKFTDAVACLDLGVTVVIQPDGDWH
jgi:hypothetical protein